MDLYEFFNLFYPISQSEYDLFRNSLKVKTFKKGDLIIVPGQVQKELFFVRKGVQMSYVETVTRIHVVAFTYPPNPCAIPESFSFQKPSTYSLTCLSDSEMEYISFESLQQLFDKSQSIERLFRRMTEAILAGLINRHIELHALSMEERYRAFCQRSSHLLQLVPHKFIASYLNIDPTNFSKLFNTIRI
ncbi:Crp/Fnr family transcriptional regulator [Rhodocytophaga rosea]|uniref:Crp/Fnr family transcriptional regulator n=1 Tax=Rhodocytophaga rosea TaxID=2704465 RepID=A0A6C0GH83_9BACT|nr:Crp/Fnr family transcriptional regulator [Rhodocytophaga rosea]QHT67060.1 Crp/Fnr family transcriptional regulator [Rhodocytophaga rosea]